MVELRDRGRVTTLFAEAELSTPGALVLGDDAAQHARARRLVPGNAIRLTDGRGHIASGAIAEIRKHEVDATIASVQAVERLPALHLFVPIADRERMLMLGEKAVELGVTGWHPVLFHRSLSVATSGGGEGFQRKFRARMIAALEQSGGAWLPEVHDPVPLSKVIEWDANTKVVMDQLGSAALSSKVSAPVAVVIGPEGGLELNELDALIAAGWQRSRLAGNTLRFETAGIAAAALMRAALDRT
jgi:16S rRNA (uracil1498-N3)-methyltransferase